MLDGSVHVHVTAKEPLSVLSRKRKERDLAAVELPGAALAGLAGPTPAAPRVPDRTVPRKNQPRPAAPPPVPWPSPCAARLSTTHQAAMTGDVRVGAEADPPASQGRRRGRRRQRAAGHSSVARPVDGVRPTPAPASAAGRGSAAMLTGLPPILTPVPEG